MFDDFHNIPAIISSAGGVSVWIGPRAVRELKVIKGNERKAAKPGVSIFIPLFIVA